MSLRSDRFNRRPPSVELPIGESLVGYISLRENGELCVSFEPAFCAALKPVAVDKIADCVRDYLRREVGGIQ